MTTNSIMRRVNELAAMRGFRNLLRKENQSWWGTRRWWINALLWTGMLSGLAAVMLFVLPALAEASGDPSVAALGGPLTFAMEMGRSVFFEFGTLAIAIGVIVLTQDAIVEEKQLGLTEWLLAKPVTRRAYILAKLVAALTGVLVLLVLLPALVTYGLFCLRLGQAFPLPAFLLGTGILALHSVYYLCFTLMLGTIFSSRSPIMGLAVGMLLGGNLLASLVKPLMFFTPWVMGKISSLAVGGQPIPDGLLWPPLAATLLWSVGFILVALRRFEKTEF